MSPLGERECLARGCCYQSTSDSLNPPSLVAVAAEQQASMGSLALPHAQLDKPRSWQRPETPGEMALMAPARAHATAPLPR